MGGWSSSRRFAIIIFNLLIDLLYAWIDPRIRVELMEARHRRGR